MINNSSFKGELGRTEYRIGIIVRFSLLETSCEQDDNFPSSISLKVSAQHLSNSSKKCHFNFQF